MIDDKEAIVDKVAPREVSRKVVCLLSAIGISLAYGTHTLGFNRTIPFWLVAMCAVVYYVYSLRDRLVTLTAEWGLTKPISTNEVVSLCTTLVASEVPEHTYHGKALWLGREARYRLKFDRYTDPTSPATLSAAGSMVGSLLSDPKICPDLRRVDRLELYPLAVAASLVPSRSERVALAALASGAIAAVHHDVRRARYAAMPISPKELTWWERFTGARYRVIQTLPAAGSYPF